MEQVLLKISKIIQDIKTEVEESKNFKNIKVLSYQINMNDNISKEFLECIVLDLNLNLIRRINDTSIIVSFKNDSEKLYCFTIYVEMEKSEPKLLLEISYLSVEHKSLDCNWNSEHIDTLTLNDKTREEIIDWFKQLRGIKRTIYCHYCGEITFEL